MKFEGKNLSCIRGDKTLFRKINFILSAGQSMFIHGHNGSGKTSLLKIIAGLVAPHKGMLYWNEFPIRQNTSDFRSVINYVGHKEGIRKALTPYENIRSHLALAGIACSKEKIAAVLDAFELQKAAYLPCEVLSRGQARKVMLAAMILKQKKLWVLDEPFSALDKNSCLTLAHYAAEHKKEGGMLIMTSHTTVAVEDFDHIIDLSC